MTFEIEATFRQLDGNETLTFNVRQAPDDSEITKIIISLPEHLITVDRRASSLTIGNTSPDSGFFRLLDLGTRDESRLEDLHVRIFVDNSIVEVYANDRFALSSRIYPSLETALGVSCSFLDGEERLGHEKVELQCWEGLVNAWPGRDHALAEMNMNEKIAKLDMAELSLQAISA